MRCSISLRSACLFGAISAWAPAALANIEPPAPYDARSVGLGSTGVAYTLNAAAVYQNPADLQGIALMAFTVDVSPAAPSLEAPLSGPDAPTTHSSRSPFPLFLAGGAYRLHERVVLGLAVYPTAGAGASYEKVAALGGNDLKVGALALEASPALSVALLKNLSLGLGYRVSYVTQTADTVQSVPGPMGMPVPTTAEANLSGFNFTALSAGLYYEPAPKIALGFTYRSRMSADLSGTTSIGGGPGLDTKSSFETPHELRVGSAFWLADDRVMLALDFKYLLYGDMKTVDTTVTTPQGTQTSATTYDWHNVAVLGLGAEVLVHPKVPLRIGYSESGSATSSSYPSPFLPPPSAMHTVHGGAGLKLAAWDIDLGAMYSFGGTDVSNPAPPGVPGHYGVNTLYIAGSATYHR